MTTAAPSMYLSTDIPSGNGVVAAIDGDHITLKPDLRGNAAWWFYWHVAIRQAKGRRLWLHFPERATIGPAGIAVSRDQGDSWSWIGTPSGIEAVVDVPDDCDDLRVAVTMPYTSRDWNRAVADIQGLKQGVLCRSNGGREVPIAHLGVEPLAARAQVVLTSRHHCCETMASFVLDGLLAAWAGDPSCSTLRATTSLLAIPFVDRDGVEQGDQGKFRAPFDHNQSYRSDRYPETVAIRALMDEDGRRGLPTYSLDLHCPFIRGKGHEHIFIVGSGRSDRADEQRRFAAVLATAPGHILGFTTEDILPHGVGWNSTPPDEARSCSAWFATRPGCRLAATLEIPYGMTKGHPITAGTARDFGATLARSLALFIGTS